MVLRSDLTGAWMCRLSDDGTHWGQKNSEIATKILCHDDFMVFKLVHVVRNFRPWDVNDESMLSLMVHLRTLKRLNMVLRLAKDLDLPKF